MVFTEAWNTTYSAISTLANITKDVGSQVLESSGVLKKPAAVMDLPVNLQNLEVSTLVHTSHPVIRVAAISGAMAAVLGAYGAHSKFYEDESPDGNEDLMSRIIPALTLKEEYKDRKHIFKIANEYHFFHTIALLGVPLSGFPKTTATMMGTGMLLFCGTCYYNAFTGDHRLKVLTPVGGIFLILGWLSMIL